MQYSFDGEYYWNGRGVTYINNVYTSTINNYNGNDTLQYAQIGEESMGKSWQYNWTFRAHFFVGCRERHALSTSQTMNIQHSKLRDYAVSAA